MAGKIEEAGEDFDLWDRGRRLTSLTLGIEEAGEDFDWYDRGRKRLSLVWGQGRARLTCGIVEVREDFALLPTKAVNK